MSRELVKRISVKNGNKITVNSACSNVYPKTYETWEYTGSIHELIWDILGSNLDVYPQTKGKFIDYFAMGILEISKRYYGGDVEECYQGVKKNVWYSPEFDDDTKKPTPNDKKSLKELVSWIEKCIKNNTKIDDKRYYVKLKNDSYLAQTPKRNGSYEYSYGCCKDFSISEAVISVIYIYNSELEEVKEI